MDYYGLLFLYYLKGLSGKSILRLFFNIEAGGTEQLLPENTSAPTTTPILADIQYPDGLRTDQYFTYRETPTTVSNKARIKTIKGNTLVWNQLVQNGNFADTSKWTKGSGTSSLAISNNEAVITIGGTWNNDVRQNQGASFISGHKYFASFEAKATAQITVALSTFNATHDITFATLTDLQTAFKKIASIVTAQTNADSFRIVLVENGSSYVGETFTVRNVQIIDLTQMGLDSITDPSEFTSLFPLPYYDYNAGSLLSFNGNGIKTVGKNLLSYSGENLPYNANGVSITREDNIYKVVATNPSGYPFARISTISYLPKGQYTVTMLGAETSNTGIAWRLIDRNVSPVKIFVNTSASITTFTLNEDVYDVYFEITIDASKLTAGTLDVRFQLNTGTPSDYEPYTSTTTSLPISTYFTNGMKSAGSVYDELTPTKAITRVGIADLGSLEWTSANTSTQGISRMRTSSLGNVILKPADVSIKANVVCANYETLTANSTYIKNTGISVDGGGDILVYDPNYNTSESVASFKQAVSGKYLYYELATPTETPITTEDANEALSLLMGKSVSSNNANQLIDIITKGE